MGGGPVWEPASAKEVAYYDKLFEVVDRDKSGTLDGQEAVKFLSFSGLTKAQLKDVWSVSNSPGQALLQRNEFYVAMRAVALAQSGEAQITSDRLRETATDSIAIATFKGIPQAPIKASKGRKAQLKLKQPKSVLKEAVPQKLASSATTMSKTKKSKSGASDMRVESKDVSAKEKESNRSSSENRKGKGLENKKKNAPAPTENAKRPRPDSTRAAPTSSSDKDDDNGTRLGDGIDKSPRTCRDSKWTSDGEKSGSISGSGVSVSEGSLHDRGHNQGENSDPITRRAEDGHDGDKNGNDNGPSLPFASVFDAINNSVKRKPDNSKVGKSTRVEDDQRGGAHARRGKKAISTSQRLSLTSSSANSKYGSTSKKEDQEGVEGPDPFAMSKKSRASYQAIFKNFDAAGDSLSEHQVAELFSRSGLDKTALGKIWRLSDLDENGSLLAEEFEIALHLIFCATQRKLLVPNELPPGLWPAGYVPPSVLARQEKEAKCERGREHKKEAGLCWQEEEPRPKDSKKQRAGIIVTAKRRINKNENDNTSKKNKADPNKETKGRGLKGEVEKGEAERPKEQAAKKATSLQNNEEVGNKSVQKNARKKGKHEEHNVFSASQPPSPEGEETQSSNTVLTECVKVVVGSKGEKGNRMGATTAEQHLQVSDAPPIPAIAGDNAEIIKPKTRKKKKGRESAPHCPSMVVSSSEGGEVLQGSDEITVAGLSLVERRTRKVRAHLARVENAHLKKDIALGNDHLEVLYNQDISGDLSVKAGKPKPKAQTNTDMHMPSDPESGGNSCGNGSSFARLSAPLPYLTPHPGRAPSLQIQEFSVSFPSGVRRASSLTLSLDLRLGPPLPPQSANDNVGSSKDGDLVRCPECAAYLNQAQIGQHIRSTCRLLPCTHCSRLLLPAAQELHVEEACPNRRRSCMRCGEAVAVSSFTKHEKEGGCIRRAVPCVACGEFCFADELKEHEATECSEMEVRCPCCGDALPARQLDGHVSSLCRGNTWTCGCGQGPFLLVDRPVHLNSCEAFIDAWEASIEKMIAQMPKIEVVRNIGKVMILTHVKDPGLALLALAETKGKPTVAALNITDSRTYLDELDLAADIVNVSVFLKALNKPGRRGTGALWRAGM